MKAEIISIGTEILIGSILNTNARFLAQKLAENGIDVYHQTAVGDNAGRIVEAFRLAASRADILISSGGLGPTEDDVTMKSVSRFTGRQLLLHRPTHTHICRVLERRGYPITRFVARQCYLPKDSFIMQNERGTAPGVLIEFSRENQKKWLLVLPGPPKELEPIFIRQALPLLIKRTHTKREHFIVKSIKITGLLESQVAQKTTDLLKLKPPLTVGIYASPGMVELKIMGKSRSLKQISKKIIGIEKIIRKRFGNHVFGTGNETLASTTGTLLRKIGKKLATAESCTGGLLSHLITEVPGSSDYFLGSVVAYHNRIKSSQLNIDLPAIKKNGAVSETVAKKMAQNVRDLLKSDYGIGITGIAGPGGSSKAKPVGLVYIAVAAKRRTFCKKFRFFGTRSEIKSSAAHKALDSLRLELLKAR